MKLKVIDSHDKNNKLLNTIRKIEKKQTNAIKFDTGSWLGLGSTGETAKDFTFKNDTFTYHFFENEYLTYQFI